MPVAAARGRRETFFSSRHWTAGWPRSSMLARARSEAAEPLGPLPEPWTALFATRVGER